ncbi:MAG TPA: aminotransferase class III-fold pyridoxal phosphate-dependent enzyme [Candidatus Lustribacter sp.]
MLPHEVTSSLNTGRVWLPFTQMTTFEAEERTFVRASGTTLFDSRGRASFDAVSSIWTCVHGHCHPTICEAISRQASRLDHATALGATNPVAEELAELLCEATGLARVFFAADGASAVEAALKMARQYWVNRGQPQRNRFVHLRSSYHGDTVGSMSVSDIEVFRRNFDPLCFETVSYEDFRRDPDRTDVAAVIVEPRVQAAAGMRIVPASDYAALLDITPLLIVDEIATGFGRTGSMFAFTELGLVPDLLCLGKGITGGTLALSATLASDRVFEAFLSGSAADLKHFFHGHSYAANPIACAAAIASFELFATENTMESVRTLARHLALLAGQLASNSRVADIRHLGLMCGIELRPEMSSKLPAPTSRAWNVANALYERGHFTRPIGDVIQFVPPLSSETADLDGFFAALADVLR